MARYDELLNRLLFEDPSKLDEDTYLLSLYIDTHSKSRSQIETSINSFLKQGYEKKEVLKKKDKVKKAITERVFKAIQGQDVFKRGLAIYLKFTLEGNIDSLELVHLHATPKDEEIYIGKIYDLDQLIWINNVTRDALVIHLEINDAKIYLMSGSDFVLLKEIELELDDDVRSFVNEYNPTKGRGGIFQSGGGKSMEKKRRDFLRTFFNEVIKYVKSNYKGDSSIDYIVIFHSTAYDFMSDDISKKVKRDIVVTPLIYSQGIKGKNELQSYAKKKIEEFERALKRDILVKAKKKNELYVKDWDDVCESVNMAKIENLFIALSASKEGYVKDNGLIYTQPVTESRKVKNIAHKIIRKVLEQGGKVYVLKEKGLIDGEISAQLRFR
jgi:hypothetical protein